MVLTIIALIAWQGIKAYLWVLSWIVRTWMWLVWKMHWWYVKGMSNVLDRTSLPQSPQTRSPNGTKRRAIEMQEQSRETSREPSPVRIRSLEYGESREAAASTGYVSSFKLAAFSACFEAIDNLRRRDSIIGVHDEELIQMLSTIIRGGREMYSMRIPWPPGGMRGEEGEGSRTNGVNGSHRPASPIGTDDWEAIYSKYRSKTSTSVERDGGEGTSDTTRPRAKSPEYVDNLNKIHTSLASLHAIVEKTNAEKEEFKKLQSSVSGSASSIASLASPMKEEKERRKEEERSVREKKEEKEKSEKKREEKEDLTEKKPSIDDLFDDGSDTGEERGSTVPPSAKRRKEETREEKRKRKEEERKRKRGGEDEFLDDEDEDESHKKEREKEKRREEREREKRQAIMAISGCYTVTANEKMEREREREREKARREDKEEEERERLKEKALEKERRWEKEEEKRKKDEEEKKKREEDERKRKKEKEEDENRRREDEREKELLRSTSSPPVMFTRKLNKKCTCTLPFPDLSELNEKQGTSYKTLEETGGNWTDLKYKLHSIVATLRNGRWVRARVNETRADGLYLGLESSGGGGFSGRVKECTGCAHINKIVAIEKK